MAIETLILKTELSDVFRPDSIRLLCEIGYEKTGNKFSVEFHGSKGYLSHLEISCEGFQNENNRIFDLFNKDGSVKKKILNIYHSATNGVRLSFGKDKARVVEELKIMSFDNAAGYSDLPF